VADGLSLLHKLVDSFNFTQSNDLWHNIDLALANALSSRKPDALALFHVPISEVLTNTVKVISNERDTRVRKSSLIDEVIHRTLQGKGGNALCPNYLEP
jgi:hypothetical protein